MIIRQIQAVIESQLFKGKAVVVIGARQVGKSTLLRAIASAQASTYLMLNCDEPEVKELLQSINTTELRQLIGSNKIGIAVEALSDLEKTPLFKTSASPFIIFVAIHINGIGKSLKMIESE